MKDHQTIALQSITIYCKQETTALQGIKTSSVSKFKWVNCSKHDFNRHLHKYKSSGKQNSKEADIANMKSLHWNEHATITFRNCEETNYSAMNLKSLLKVQQVPRGNIFLLAFPFNFAIFEITFFLQHLRL